jgi:hypothetical protein
MISVWESSVRKIYNLFTLTVTILILSFSIAAKAVYPGAIQGTQDDTTGVWLFSAGTDTEPGGEPTDNIVRNAIDAGILKLIGNDASEITAFHTGPPESYETPRDNTMVLVVQGLSAIDDFGLIEEADDPSANFDAGIGGWVDLGDFGEIHSDGLVANGTIGPSTGVDPEVALNGFEIFFFEDAELSGFVCQLTKKSGGTITFTIADRQVNPNTPSGADDTLIAVDLDSIPGFDEEADTIVAIQITDDGISQTPPVFGDTTLELDAVATRVSVVVEYGSISGYKWNDLDGDTIKDAGEPGLSGWTISLSGHASGSTTTDSNGYYEFTDLEAGTYTVSETLKSGWTQTFPTAPGTHSITLTAGQDSTNNNFGNKEIPPPPSVGGRGLVIEGALSYLVPTIIAASLIGVVSYGLIKNRKD